MTRFAAAICLAMLLACGSSTSARQDQVIRAHPIFSGVWSPVDAKASDTFFSVGLSIVSGGAKLSIDQKPDRIAVGVDLPEQDLSTRLLFAGRFFATVVYPIARRPVGGGGAAPNVPAEAAWDGETLVIPSASTSGTVRGNPSFTFSLDGARLSLKSQFRLPESGKVNTVTQLFDRAK